VRSRASGGGESLRGVSTGSRLAVATVVGTVGAGTLFLLGAGRYAPAAGWDAGAVFLLVWVWFTVWPMGSEQTAAYTTREDPSRAVSDPVLLQRPSSVSLPSASSSCRPVQPRAQRRTS
jgi:hypothetical protein